jgi:hypothetical protein
VETEASSVVEPTRELMLVLVIAAENEKGLVEDALSLVPLDSEELSLARRDPVETTLREGGCTVADALEEANTDVLEVPQL